MPQKRLFLPLSRPQASALEDRDCAPAALFSQWSIPSLAAVIAIQSLPTLAQTSDPSARLERALASLIDAGFDLESAGQGASFSSLVFSRFNPKLFSAGLNQLRSLSVRLLDPEDLDAEGYLTEDRKWDFEFTSRHAEALNPFTERFVDAAGKSFTLAPQQARAFRVFKSELDEDFHLQALAGTGKTFMIERLIDCLTSYRPLVLAMTKVQLDALQQRVGTGRVTGMTFSELAVRSLQLDVGRHGSRSFRLSMRRARVEMSQIANHLEFKPVGNLTPSQVASVANRTVFRYCTSRDAEIGVHHLPSLGGSYSVPQKELLVQCANRLWQETIFPSSSSLELPVRGYHRIKEVSLSGTAAVEPGFTHVIVDEAHDLPAPMAQFLDRCSIPVITLGDSCQRLDGAAVERAPHVRRREIFHSLRSGREMEAAVNTLIEQNPVVDVHPLEGNREQDTRVVFYSRPFIPEQPTTILVWSEWGMFEWFQRLANAKAQFSLLPGCEGGFRWFVLDCIGLYREGIRPTHGALFKYTSWDALRKDVSKRESAFDRIDRMLEKGYSTMDFERSLMKLDQAGKAPYKLGTVVAAKNSEVNSVMLAPELLDSSGSDRLDAARAFAAVYTGGTRARHQLFVPGHLQEWASDTAARARCS